MLIIIGFLNIYLFFCTLNNNWLILLLVFYIDLTTTTTYAYNMQIEHSTKTTPRMYIIYIISIHAGHLHVTSNYSIFQIHKCSIIVFCSRTKTIEIPCLRLELIYKIPLRAYTLPGRRTSKAAPCNPSPPAWHVYRNRSLNLRTKEFPVAINFTGVVPVSCIIDYIIVDVYNMNCT